MPSGVATYDVDMLADRLDQLVLDLASADPAIRDDGAYDELARAVGDGDLTAEQSSQLGARMVERLHHPEPQARSFAPLVLAVLAARGIVEPEWVTAVQRWYVTEPDLRGYDPELGWVHAAAHGADCVAEFGLARAAAPLTLLATLVQRIVAPTDHVFRDQEDDRIAHAMATLLTDDRLASETVDGWLAPVAGLLAEGVLGPVPPHVSNTLRTLRCLSVLLGAHLLIGGAPVSVPRAEAVRSAIATTLRPASPWMYA